MVVICMKTLTPTWTFDWLGHPLADGARPTLSVVSRVIVLGRDVLHHPITLVVVVAEPLSSGPAAALSDVTDLVRKTMLQDLSNTCIASSAHSAVVGPAESPTEESILATRDRAWLDLLGPVSHSPSSHICSVIAILIVVVVIVIVRRSRDGIRRRAGEVLENVR